MIFGFSGKMGTGKNYICENLFLPMLKQVYNQDAVQMAFADQIKVNVMVKYNISKFEVFDDKNYKIRQLLQHEGTTEGRYGKGENIWISYLENWMNVHKSRGVYNFVITDVRFKNEADFIKSKGGRIIRVDAPDRHLDRIKKENLTPDIYEHISETDLDNYSKFDLVMDNRYGANLIRNKEILKDFYLFRYLNI
jgi:hypothetical protein